MSAGDWIAVASAVIAAAGALYARRQAGQAKRSAGAAERQAVAAEQQVAIMRQQVANEAADRHQAAGPRFTVKSAVIKDNPESQPMAHIMIEQVSGTPAAEVRVTALRNDNVHGLVQHVADYSPREIIWRDTAPGTTHMLTAYLEYNFRDPVNVVLDFTSVQAGTGHTWQCTLTAVPHRPAPEPRRRSGRVLGYE